MGVAPRLLKPVDAATYLGVTEEAIRMMAKRRQIPIVKRGRTLLFDVHQLDEWIERHTIEAAS